MEPPPDGGGAGRAGINAETKHFCQCRHDYQTTLVSEFVLPLVLFYFFLRPNSCNSSYIQNKCPSRRPLAAGQDDSLISPRLYQGEVA